MVIDTGELDTQPLALEALSGELVTRARELLDRAAGLLVAGELSTADQDELLRRTVELARYVNSALGLLELAHGGMVIDLDRQDDDLAVSRVPEFTDTEDPEQVVVQALLAAVTDQDERGDEPAEQLIAEETEPVNGDVTTLLPGVVPLADAGEVSASAELELLTPAETPIDTEPPAADEELQVGGDTLGLAAAVIVGNHVTFGGESVQLSSAELEILRALLPYGATGASRRQIDGQLTFLEGRASHGAINQAFAYAMNSLRVKLNHLAPGALTLEGSNATRTYHLNVGVDLVNHGVTERIAPVADAAADEPSAPDEPVQPAAPSPDVTTKPQGIERSGMVLALDGVVASGRFVPISKEERRVIRELFETGRSFTLTELTQAVCRKEDVSVAER